MEVSGKTEHVLSVDQLQRERERRRKVRVLAGSNFFPSQQHILGRDLSKVAGEDRSVTLLSVPRGQEVPSICGISNPVCWVGELTKAGDLLRKGA